MTATDLLTHNRTEFLRFFQSKFPIFHLSNVYHLDLKYALKYYLRSNHINVSDEELEGLTETLVSEMVADGILKQVSSGTWTLIYPEFRTKAPGKPVFQ